MANEVEPWLRGTHADAEPVLRAVLHALELAGEDIERWCGPLATELLEARPFGLPSVGFQVRHIARSVDRLLTYAEGEALSPEQLAALRQEMDGAGDAMQEFRAALALAHERLLRLTPDDFAKSRGVGRAMLPATVAGLLIHIAEHTQRHVGQAITTVKVVHALHEAETS